MTVELLRIHAVDSEIGMPMHLRCTGPCMHARTHTCTELQFAVTTCPWQINETYVADIKIVY